MKGDSAGLGVEDDEAMFVEETAAALELAVVLRFGRAGKTMC
jgi:hypothetical protein